MDKLVINHLKITTLIGVHAWEKRCPQNIYLDITLKTNAQKAAWFDSLDDALDYDKIVQHIQDFTSKNQFQLIETLADKLAKEILSHFPTQEITLTLRKPGAIPLAKEVSITVERTQDDLTAPLT